MGKLTYRHNDIWYPDVRVSGQRFGKCVDTSRKIAELAFKKAGVRVAREELNFALEEPVSLLTDHRRKKSKAGPAAANTCHTPRHQRGADFPIVFFIVCLGTHVQTTIALLDFEAHIGEY